MKSGTYLAHNCPACGFGLYIHSESLAFFDVDYKPIRKCPDCNRKLTIPPGLLEMQDKPWEDGNEEI